MRIAVSTSKGGLEDGIFPVFGRCPTFTLVDTPVSEGGVRVVKNPGAEAGGGAGIAAARSIADANAEAVITGSCGPNAMAVLLSCGIKVYTSSGGVRNAVDALLQGKLGQITSPTSAPHAGMGRRRRGI